MATISSERNAIVRKTEMLVLHCFRTPHSCALSMWRWLKISLFQPYRPELHYMRGPGPKSQEKHARGVGFAS
jgi:hypothetical protein